MSNFYAFGTSSKNPLDVSAQIFNHEAVYKIINLALSDKNIDGLILDLPSYYFNRDFSFGTGLDESYENKIIDGLTLGHKHNKPLIPIIKRINCPDDRDRLFKKLTEKKVPVFEDPLEFIPLLPIISKFTRKNSSKKGEN